MFQPPIFDYLLLKLATRCNLDCTYCYWFRDSSVLEKPPLLTREVETALLEKLEAHVVRHELRQFSILFHGGEPLLFGKRRFVGLVTHLRELEARTGCAFDLSMTSNGALVDKEWAVILRYCGVAMTLSIDGPAALHDRVRVDRKGRGSHASAVRALQLLRRYDLEPGVLAVSDPQTEPDDVVRYFVDELGLKHFDILVPDATHEDHPPSIAAYYKRLFDLWYGELADRGVEVRYVRAILKGILGGSAHLESIGYGPIQTCAVLTDGALEPVDVLRIAGYRSTTTNTSILTHTFQDVIEDPVWRRAFDAAINLPEACRRCDYATACGGGFLPHRWSRARGYDNPSVYCPDLMALFDHVWGRVASELRLQVGGTELTLAQAARDLTPVSPSGLSVFA